MELDEILEEVVYAIFEGKIELNDPQEVIEEIKIFLRKKRII